jgi:hypothetical protein
VKSRWAFLLMGFSGCSYFLMVVTGNGHTRG